MRVLITRPQPDADRTGAAVRAAGHEPLVCPLMRVDLRPEALHVPVGTDALAFTSANGVRAYAAADGPPLPTYAVGPASAREAAANGLPVVGVAAADVASLAAMIAQAGPPRVLHVSGKAAAGDLCEALRFAGVVCERTVLYEAVAETALTPAMVSMIRSGPDWLLLYSPRSARLFERLVRSAGLEASAAGMRLAALSPAVSGAIALPFAERHVPDRPASSALVDIISGRDT